MSAKKRTKTTLARGDDPLGIGLKSIPEPLQRWWLIGQGNPHFDDDVRGQRPALGIPADGFADLGSYVEYVVGRRAAHGHGDPPGIYVNQGALTRIEFAGMSWPLEHPRPSPCCEQDPLYAVGRSLAQRYGIDEAEAEPGFARVETGVVEYLVAAQWPRRRSARGRSPIFETVSVEHPGQPGERSRFVERYRTDWLGLPSRAGRGGMLPVWYRWWKERLSGKTWTQIQIGTVDALGNDHWFEEGAIRNGVAQVERLMKPVESPQK